MNDYKLGRIYKVITRESNDIYIGSTFNELRHRFIMHKRCYNNSLKDRGVSIRHLFNNYGINNCKIVLIKEYVVVDKRHLEVYEALWICKLNKYCVNQNIPFGFSSIKSFRKKYYKQYYNDKRETRLEYQKEYNKNKEYKIKEYQKKYQKEHKDNIKEYLIKNKNKIKERMKHKIECECGSIIRKDSLSRHYTSKKHQNFLNR